MSDPQDRSYREALDAIAAQPADPERPRVPFTPGGTVDELAGATAGIALRDCEVAGGSEDVCATVAFDLGQLSSDMRTQLYLDYVEVVAGAAGRYHRAAVVEAGATPEQAERLTGLWWVHVFHRIREEWENTARAMGKPFTPRGE